jgi:CheY-like chemotaxis protein
MLDRLESLGYDGVLPRSANPTRLRRDIERLFHAELDDDDHDTTTRTGPGKPLPIGRVLVVDDQLINLRLMEEYLQVLGLEFDSFADGEHALESCAVIHYELILLDLHMPDLDGFTLARLIREQPGPNRDSVIFAVTADNHPQRRRQALEAGYNGLLIKPVSLKQLHNMIDEHCGQPLPAMLPAPPRDTGQPRHDALLELLLRELPEQRRLLQIALQTNDASALHELAHTLDGNARYCPTPELQRAAAKLAAAAQDGWRAPLTPLTVALLREIDRLTQGQSITN